MSLETTEQYAHVEAGVMGDHAVGRQVRLQRAPKLTKTRLFLHLVRLIP